MPSYHQGKAVAGGGGWARYRGDTSGGSDAGRPGPVRSSEAVDEAAGACECGLVREADCWREVVPYGLRVGGRERVF